MLASLLALALLILGLSILIPKSGKNAVSDFFRRLGAALGAAVVAALALLGLRHRHYA